MSEVKRYSSFEISSGNECGPWVRHDAFDRKEFELDAARNRLDAQCLRADTAEAERDEWKRAAEMHEHDSLQSQQDLAAAEQRIARHEGMLRHFANLSDVRRVGTAAMDYVAALNLKPEAESHE